MSVLPVQQTVSQSSSFIATCALLTGRLADVKRRLLYRWQQIISDVADPTRPVGSVRHDQPKHCTASNRTYFRFVRRCDLLGLVSQFVWVGQRRSASIVCEYGVAHGSTLGSLLYHLTSSNKDLHTFLEFFGKLHPLQVGINTWTRKPTEQKIAVVPACLEQVRHGHGSTF
jgi:hypothetical protein